MTRMVSPRWQRYVPCLLGASDTLYLFVSFAETSLATREMTSRSRDSCNITFVSPKPAQALVSTSTRLAYYIHTVIIKIIYMPPPHSYVSPAVCPRSARMAEPGA